MRVCGWVGGWVGRWVCLCVCVHAKHWGVFSCLHTHTNTHRPPAFPRPKQLFSSDPAFCRVARGTYALRALPTAQNVAAPALKSIVSQQMMYQVPDGASKSQIDNAYA